MRRWPGQAAWEDRQAHRSCARPTGGSGPQRRILGFARVASLSLMVAQALRRAAACDRVPVGAGEWQAPAGLRSGRRRTGRPRSAAMAWRVRGLGFTVRALLLFAGGDGWPSAGGLSVSPGGAPMATATPSAD